MQKMTRIYQNHIAVDMAEKGWCLLHYRIEETGSSLWKKDQCLVFFPADFAPDQEFGAKLERLCNKIYMRLLWIENPAAELEFWKVTIGSWEYPRIRIGKYWIYLKNLLSESDCELVFQGIFGVNGETFSLSEEKVKLSLDNTLGALTYEFSVGPDTFLNLEVGIEYLRQLPNDMEKGEEKNYTEHFGCSVICPEDEITIQGSLSPAALWDHRISYFSLPVCNWNSTFLAPQGTNLSLKSEEGARLVFERTAESISFDETNKVYSVAGISWYLGIDGDFLYQSNEPLMLGLLGTEYFSGVGKLRFFANKPGILGMEEVEERTDQEGRPCIVTTPWLSIQGTYHSSSSSMPFFAKKDNYLRNSVPMIKTYEEVGEPFPILPWSGIRFLNEDSTAAEAEGFLQQKRSEILTGQLDMQVLGAAAEAEQLLITPCGMCVSAQSDSGHWNWVGIAQIAGTGSPDIRMQNPALSTRIALQKTECILVASTLESFNGLSETELDLSFCIDGWKLCFSGKNWTEHSLFMMKYAKSVSVRSLLGQSPQLAYVLERAYDSEGNVERGFEQFLEIIDDADFQGILMLGGLAEADSLSPELKAVLEFTGEAGLEMVYAAITNGRVVADGTEFSVERSNVNALVLYSGEPEHKEDGASFEFCTRDLKVLIEQSKVRHFQSHSELSLYKLFGSALYPEEAMTGSCLVLTGRIEEVNGQQTYKFLLETPVSYKVSDSALASLEIRNVEMSAGTGTLRFLLQGLQTYTLCENLDLFSYDKIEFDGVCLIKGADQKVVDYGSYELYGARAVVRTDSLVEAFGAQLKEFICSDRGDSPDDMGYVSINAPVKQGTLGEEWYGIIWKISLNSSGQLGNNEPLYFELLAAWSGANYYIGIKTGGIFGKSFSLQGILTAGFTGITMEKGNGGKVYLHLHSFSLKALGITLPQKGVDVYILGEQGKAAWYAAYDDGEKENVIL